MKIERFEGVAIRAAGLFSTGPGGRHDWMRFHAHDVNCPQDKCPGILLFSGSMKLMCNVCKTEFKLFRIQKRKRKKDA